MSYFHLSTPLAELLPPGRIIVDPAQVERLSKDYYWYSPVLERQLKELHADFVASPATADEIEVILRFAYAHDLPVTVRGAGTGNYGQAVPLYGGLVLDLSRLDRILEITPDGVCRAEPGTRLAVIEEAARKVGWELRCYPSTFMKASVGGFICGGSGGIGSITYGQLRENGTVRGVELMTLEENPRRVWLRGDEIFQAMHAYGTTGVLISVELTLGPKIPWGQIAATFNTFAACLDFTEHFANHSPWRKRLVTCFEPPIPSYFKPLKKYLAEGKALVVLELENDGVEATAREIESRGGVVGFRQLASEPRPGPLLSDYTWNHTTLWAMKSDPALTYLQCGFSPVSVRAQMAALKEKFGDEFLFHFEFFRVDGTVIPAGIPIVRFSTEQRLREMIEFCEQIEVRVANPHSVYLEGAGRWRPGDKKIDGKKAYDPKGLFNPGKMKGYPLPPQLEKLNPIVS